jgi:hypothetical protein
MVQIDSKLVTSDAYWLGHSNRKEFKGLYFHPKLVKPDYYNLYRGFSVEPVEGDTEPFLSFCKEVVCNGDESYYEYLIAWMAHLFQKPEEKIGVAIIIRGLKGTGKGQYMNHLGSLLGNHYMAISNGEHLVGKFNAHLEKLLLLGVDEAFWSGDSKAEGILKNLVTEPRIMIERKGIDPMSLDSFVRVVMTTNNDYAVPASADERRWFVLDCANTYKGDFDYFAALQYHMDNGGREALLHYLLNYQIPEEIELRSAPATTGLGDQKVHSLDPISQWWFHCLQENELYECREPLSESTRAKKDCLTSCNKFITNHQLRKPYPLSVLGKKLHALVPNLNTIGSSSRAYVFPTLAVMRADLEQKIGEFDWDSS